MFYSKQESYKQLVSKRKDCSLCQGLSNPHHLNPSYDVPEIGAWSAWQGSLDAKIMVVGQDWADTLAYLKDGSTDSIKNPTNRNLITLLNSIGVNRYQPPSSGLKNPDLFFTNAILCLKQGENRMQEATLEEWYHTCDRHFLRRQSPRRLKEPMVLELKEKTEPKENDLKKGSLRSQGVPRRIFLKNRPP